jgi:MFS superfamily sulfate permease-like transporter
MISGCAGSMCAILQALTADSGPLGDLTLEHRREATLMTIFFVGIVQYLCAWLRLSHRAHSSAS